MEKLFKVNTNQEAFSLVKKHLLTQNKRCGASLKGCFYDGNQSEVPELAGLKCAVGALMTNEALERWGDQDIDPGYMKDLAKIAGFMVANINTRLLRSLQMVHDNVNVSEWEGALSDVANKYFLRDE
jgi:hypothetical protein